MYTHEAKRKGKFYLLFGFSALGKLHNRKSSKTVLFCAKGRKHKHFQKITKNRLTDKKQSAIIKTQSKHPTTAERQKERKKTMKKSNILEVKKWNYGNYSSDNYGANTIAVSMGERTVFYSYDTVVSFRGYNSKGEFFNCTISNQWGTTTGKHLNWIDGGDKKNRLSPEEFDAKLQEFLR